MSGPSGATQEAEVLPTAVLLDVSIHIQSISFTCLHVCVCVYVVYLSI